MTPKEIARKATAIFCSAVPPSWSIRDQQDQEDYGVDYEIEPMMSNDTATGMLFKVQQKGEKNLSWEADRSHLKLSGFSAAKLRYLYNLRSPVVLIAVDITAERCFWTVIQGNRQAKALMQSADDSRQATVTIRIPGANELPARTSELLDAVGHALEYIAVRDISTIRSKRLVRIARDHLGLTEVTDRVRAHFNLLRCTELEELLRSGGAEAVAARATQLLNSESESLDMRFASGLYVIKSARCSALERTSGDGANRSIETARKISSQLMSLTRADQRNKRLRVYARLQRRFAELQSAVEQDYAVFVSRSIQRGQRDQSSKYTAAIADLYQIQLVVKVLRQFRRIRHCADQLVSDDHFDLLPQVWAILALEMTKFISRLRQSEIDVSPIIEWLDAVGRVAVDAACALDQWDDVGFCAIQFAMLGVPDSAAIANRIQDALSFVHRIPESHKQVRDRFISEINQIQVDFAESATKCLTYDGETRYIESMARAMGVDLDNPNDEVAEVVRIGLRDRNPDRVLRRCRHLYFRLGGCGLPGKMLGLQTAGFKYLHCTKFGFGMGALSLDSLFDSFHYHHCAACTQGEPHEPDWTWALDWQRAQDEAHGERFRAMP
ncbi:MAG TPA: DUF4365 domain-containing protein [Pirellulales bacterium]|nr:DUF4365 domain-containing protein [Pirellulales bacterium]